MFLWDWLLVEQVKLLPVELLSHMNADLNESCLGPFRSNPLLTHLGNQ